MTFSAGTPFLVIFDDKVGSKGSEPHFAAQRALVESEPNFLPNLVKMVYHPRCEVQELAGPERPRIWLEGTDRGVAKPVK
jgi:hypothetical protein